MEHPIETQVRIHLSDAAVEEVRGMLQEAEAGDEGGLRLTARTGAGCSAPLQYGMFIEVEPGPDDTVLEAHGVRIFLDPEAAWILDGLMVDYVDSPGLGEGFAFRQQNGSRGRSC